MRKYLLFAGYLLSVLLTFVVIDISIGYLLDNFMFLKNNPKFKYAYEGGGGEQIVILGASRAAHHYVPAVFEDIVGLSCYNYGMDARNIFNQYCIAQHLLKDSSKQPKIAILEIAAIDIEDTPGWNDEKLTDLSVVYNFDDNVSEIINRIDKKKGWLLHHVNSYRYNSQLLDMVVSTIKEVNHNDTLNGYVPLYNIWTKEIATIDNSSLRPYHPIKLEYFKKLLMAFKDANVKLIVLFSPDYQLVSSPTPIFNDIEDICREYDVPFENHAHDSIFMANKEWFNEPFHLNDDGARIYTSIIANKIKDYLKTN